MSVSQASLWKLSYSDLAGLCQQMGHGPLPHPDPHVSEEARRLYGQWGDVLAINLHEEGAAARQAGMAAALRKRTIELAIKSGTAQE
jgi:hypothetical protein